MDRPETRVPETELGRDTMLESLFKIADELEQELPLSGIPLDADPKEEVGKYLVPWSQLKELLNNIKMRMEAQPSSEAYKTRLGLLQDRYDKWSAHIRKLQNVINADNEKKHLNEL